METTATFNISQLPSEISTDSVISDSVNGTTVGNVISEYTLTRDFENSTNITMTLPPTGAGATLDYNLINGTLDLDDFSEDEMRKTEVLHFWIGVALSVSSSLFIGLSFIIKKKALIKLSKGGKRANQGGYGYLKDILWWSGLLSMAVGEAANFMAYTFAPASLVSTLGVLSVLVTAILSTKYLEERLNFLGKIGCFLCAIGSTIIVIHAPIEKDIESMEDLQEKLSNIVFVIYVLLTIVVSVILIYHYRPKLPETSTYTLLIWIGVCSMIGSLSVMSVKGLGLALMQTITGETNVLGNWLTWFCLLTLIVCISVQMNFLNKALDTFSTAVVTPIYYVFFTTCVIIASAILFNEFAYLPIKDWVGLTCGFFTVLTAIALLHLCKNFDFTLASLAQQIDFVNEEKSQEFTSTSCGIPVKDVDLKSEFMFVEEGKIRKGFAEDEETTTTDEVYKSVESCGSSRCSRSGRASERSRSSASSRSSLSPDVGLLSVPSDQRGRRGKDGYVPLSYGTTEKSNFHSRNLSH